MKNILRKGYSILSLIYLIIAIVSLVIFIIYPSSIYRLIETIYMMFVSYYLVRSSGAFNKIKMKYLGIFGIIISLIGLFISLFLEGIIYGLLQYDNIYLKYERFYLTILYFKITIYVLFLIASIFSLIVKEKRPKIRLKSKK